MKILTICGWLFLLAAGAAAQPTKPAENLNEFLRSYLHESSTPDLRYAVAFVHLTAGSEAAIVYIEGGGWCGSGGCTALILAPEKSSYRVVSKLTIVRLPIRVLDTSTNGWRDLAVTVVGGGILRADEAWLRFDGKTYPTNPSVEPARQLPTNARGKIVISDKTRLTPLFAPDAVR